MPLSAGSVSSGSYSSVRRICPKVPTSGRIGTSLVTGHVLPPRRHVGQVSTPNTIGFSLGVWWCPRPSCQPGCSRWTGEHAVQQSIRAEHRIGCWYQRHTVTLNTEPVIVRLPETHNRLSILVVLAAGAHDGSPGTGTHTIVAVMSVRA